MSEGIFSPGSKSYIRKHSIELDLNDREKSILTMIADDNDLSIQDAIILVFTKHFKEMENSGELKRLIDIYG
jgi:hypothetical protein